MTKASQTATNVVAAGGLLDKTYTKAKDILDRISKSHEDWEDHGYSRSGRRRNSALGAPENDTIVALQAQVATMTNLLQTMTMNQANVGGGNQMNVVNQVAAIGCVGCGELHAYEVCR